MIVDLTIAGGCLVLGMLIVWRALVNANRMDRSTAHFIRLLNLGLCVAGVGVFLGPFVGDDFTQLALQAALTVFVVCMFIGRRPTDRVLGG